MHRAPPARVTVTCLLLLAAVSACTDPDDSQVETSEQALLAGAVIPRGATWTYWDQGAAPESTWRYTFYDDDAWRTGAGPLGYGETYVATSVGYGGDAAHKHTTTWFRREFDVSDPQLVTRLTAEVMYDDGFIVYINGTRAATVGLPTSGEVPATTYATSHEAGNTYQTFDLTANRVNLFRGQNEIAVEVHQSDASSSDLVFDLSLALEVPVLPAGVAIPRRSTWNYDDHYAMNANQTGWRDYYGDEFNWRSGVGPLGYGETYITTPLAFPQYSYQAPTTYFRNYFDLDDASAVTELTGEIMYDDGAVIWLNGQRIDAVSMPAGDAQPTTLALGHEAGNQYVTRDWSAARAYLRDGINVVAVELHQSSRTSSDAVFDVALAYRTAPPTQVPTEDIPRGAVWTYWDRGGDLSTLWRGTGYDDSAWRRAAGPLGYGETYLASTIEYGPDAANKYRTTYFRNRFRVADKSAVTSLLADVMYDDGVVIYLNGTEVKRLAMPAGTVTAATLSSGHEAGNTYQQVDLGSARALLVDGDNVLGVELHQQSASSSDLVFDLALDVGASAPPPPAAPGIARGASWRVFTGAAEPGWDWRYDSFDDDQWAILPAPLGYGEAYLRSTVPYGPDPAHKYITTYFRNEFVVDDPARVTALDIEAMYDDGMAVFLNGRLIARPSMPDYAWYEHTTLATWHEANNTYESIPLTDALDALQPGRNVIAVGVHQDDPGSSDLVFDLAVHLTVAPPAATLPRRTNWLYDAHGAAPAGWQTSNDDRGWDGGYAPIGWDENYLGTSIGYDYVHDVPNEPQTVYFRRHLSVASPAAITELRGELMYDDGAVVYINGHEVQRVGIAAGPVDFTTTAAAHEANGRYELFDWTAAASFLHAGDNLIAVEIHQEAGDTSDMAFDLAIEVITAATPRYPGCKPTTPTNAGTLVAVWIAPGGDVWVVGQSGVVGRRDAGGIWAWCWADPNASYSAVWGTGDDDVWLVGAGGVVQRWNGTTFSAVDLGTTATLTDIWGSGPGDIFVVGTSGTIRHWDGTTWHVADLPGHYLSGVWGASATDVWAVGESNTPSTDEDPYSDHCYAEIWRWDAASHTFSAEDVFGIQHGGCGFHGVSGSSTGDVWAVGNEAPAGAAAGFANAVHYDGTEWTTAIDAFGEDEELAVDRAYTDLAVHAPGAEQGAWIVGGGESAVRFDGTTYADGGAGTEDLYGIDARGTAMYAVGYPNKVMRWTGTGWARER